MVLPLTGWFSRLFGRKSFYLACVLFFIASSFLCGVASSLPMLVFFQLLVGAGGGGLAFIDVFWILGVVCLGMFPRMLLIKSAPRGELSASVH